MGVRQVDKRHEYGRATASRRTPDCAWKTDVTAVKLNGETESMESHRPLQLFALLDSNATQLRVIL